MIKDILKQKRWEYVVPGLAIMSLLISCVIVSSKKFFWNDELLSFYLLNDPSLPHMLVAWSDKFNQAPPLYFILGWGWEKLFGSSELALRLFSSVTIGLACILLWIVLRRTFDFWSTTVGILSVFCLSELVLYHNVELRMYGLFALVCVLGLLQYDTINREKKAFKKSLLVNAIIHSSIVLTHLYGVFYSSAILASFVIYDRCFGTFRKRVYLSVLAGWAILVPLTPLIINQSNNSAKWFQKFSLSQTISLLTPFPRFFLFILSLLVITAFLRVVRSNGHNKEVKQSNLSARAVKGEAALLIIAIVFLFVPLVAWVITVTLKPILNDRYIIPTITISWSILLTYLIARMIPHSQQPMSFEESPRKLKFYYLNLRSLILAALTLGLLLHPLYYAKREPGSAQMPGANDLSYGYSDLPIAMEAGHDFLPRFFYSEKPSRYFHILDWETAVNNVTSAYATGDYVHLNAISTHYPFIQSVQSKDFLDTHNQFLVLNEEDQKWFEKRIQNNSTYQIKELGTEPGANAPLTMFLVERQSS